MNSGTHECSDSTGLPPSRHTKFYSIDEQLVSIGSQNMYICELDEETNVYDDVNITKKIMEEFYNPIWNLSVESKAAAVREMI